ncbi:MAG: hypothetical protein H7Z75_11910 [Ferruginibacter sp.]|nr:hypothetical protein [Cytophagales bacterium]
MRNFRFLLPATIFVLLFASCQRPGYSPFYGVSNRQAKANVRYYRHQKEGLRLSSAATRYNVNYRDYQREGLRLSSRGY